MDTRAEVAIGGVRCWIAAPGRAWTNGEGGNEVAPLPLVSLTLSDHSLRRGCQSELRAGSLWLQTDTDSEERID